MFGELRPLGSGNSLRLEKERILIGSHRFCDAVIHSRYVHPVHSQFLYRDSAWYVRDLSGAQATEVNALSVTESRIYHGDILCIGDRHYEFLCEFDKANAG
jgi:pSer/pThr/pTyr-binding forkhead associated (FHA) protein